MASASRKARKTFSGLVAKTRCKRTVLPWDMMLLSMTERSILQGLAGLAQSLPQGRLASLRADIGAKKYFRRVGARPLRAPFYFAWGCFRDFVSGPGVVAPKS